jgi:hypothetical protein
MVITASPVDQNAKVGDTAAFGVEVKGGTPSNYTYQWYYSALLTGGEGDTRCYSLLYVILSVQMEDGGYYYCTVSDG